MQDSDISGIFQSRDQTGRSRTLWPWLVCKGQRQGGQGNGWRTREHHPTGPTTASRLRPPFRSSVTAPRRSLPYGVRPTLDRPRRSRGKPRHRARVRFLLLPAVATARCALADGTRSWTLHLPSESIGAGQGATLSLSIRPRLASSRSGSVPTANISTSRPCPSSRLPTRSKWRMSDGTRSNSTEAAPGSVSLVA